MSTMSYDRILGVSPWFGLVGQGLMGFLGILAGHFSSLCLHRIRSLVSLGMVFGVCWAWDSI